MQEKHVCSISREDRGKTEQRFNKLFHFQELLILGEICAGGFKIIVACYSFLPALRCTQCCHSDYRGVYRRPGGGGGAGHLPHPRDPPAGGEVGRHN